MYLNSKELHTRRSVASESSEGSKPSTGMNSNDATILICRCCYYGFSIQCSAVVLCKYCVLQES